MNSHIILIDFIVNDSADFKGNLIPIYESFIQQLKSKQPHANLIFVASCSNDGCTNAKNVIYWMSTIYSIPLISYYDLAHCAAHMVEESKYHSTIQRYWGDVLHPNWRIHQLIADSVSYSFFYNSIITKCQDTSSSPFYNTLSRTIELNQYKICQHPSTFYSAHHAFNNSDFLTLHNSNENKYNMIKAHNWELTEDRRNKPGWISQNINASISFLCHFGVEPRLVVTYLRSYHGLGNVTMTLNDRSIILEGLYGKEEQSKHVSQAYMKTFLVSSEMPFKNFEYTFGFGVKPNSSLYVQFTTMNVLPFKFKLLSISSC